MKKSLHILESLVLSILLFCAGCVEKQNVPDKKDVPDNKDTYSNSKTMKGCSDESKQKLTDAVNEMVESRKKEKTLDFSGIGLQDTDGNSITDEVFRSYDVTMINIWATWCRYCIVEMPGIQKLYEQKPENVNILSICTDGKDNPELMQQILENCGITYTTLLPDSTLLEKLDSDIWGFPTTYFVDSTGKQIVEKVEGMPGSADTVTDAYLNLIQSALEKVTDE